MNKSPILPVAFLAFFVLPLIGLYAQTSDSNGLMSDYGCNYVWKQSTYGADMGVNSMYSGDVDNDGITEMIFSAQYSGWDERTFWYVLEYDPVYDNYVQVFISPANGYGSAITTIEVLDADNDGSLEVAVGFQTGMVEIWNTMNFGLEKRFYLPNQDDYNRTVSSITAADGDNDGATEFICCTPYSTYFFKSPSYQLERTIEPGAARLRCGNINSDAYLEMVYSTGDVYQLTPANNSPVMTGQISNLPSMWEWFTLQLADVDNDQMAEIVFTDGKRLRVINGDTYSSKFSYSFDYEISAVALGDVDNDGQVEVVAAEYEYGDMICFELNGDIVWTVDNHGDAVSGITIGDLDNDGSNEMMWGTGYRVTDEDYIHVYSVPGLQEEWISEVYEIPYTAVEVGDVDGDGMQEVLTIEAYDGRLTIFDAITKEMEWRSGYNFAYDVYDLKLFDIDNDGQMEIILCGQRIKVYNGITHELEKSCSVLDSWEYRWLEIADIDCNGSMEYIVSDGWRMEIIDPVDGGLLWSNYERSGKKYHDLAVGNIDQDPELEIISNRTNELVIYDVPNNHENSMVMPDSTVTCLFDYDKDGTLDIMVCYKDGNLGYYNGQSLNFTELPFNLKPRVNHLKLFLYPGATEPTLAFVYDNKVCFSDNTGRFSYEWLIGDPSTDEMDLTDYNNDGYPELFVLADGMITEIDLQCFLPVALPEKIDPLEISIYPNPSSGITKVEFSGKYPGKPIMGALYNMHGVKMFSVPVLDGRGVFNCEGLPSGFYLLKIEETVCKVIVN